MAHSSCLSRGQQYQGPRRDRVARARRPERRCDRRCRCPPSRAARSHLAKAIAEVGAIVPPSTCNAVAAMQRAPGIGAKYKLVECGSARRGSDASGWGRHTPRDSHDVGKRACIILLTPMHKPARLPSRAATNNVGGAVSNATHLLTEDATVKRARNIMNSAASDTRCATAGDARMRRPRCQPPAVPCAYRQERFSSCSDQPLPSGSAKKANREPASPAGRAAGHR